MPCGSCLSATRLPAHAPPDVSAPSSDFLASVPLFGSLEASDRQRFGEVTRERTYPKGSVILFENDPGDSLYIVRSGRVKVVLIGEDGREVILGVLGTGEHFGELSLIDQQPRSATVIAMEDASLLILHRDDFRRRVEASPAVAWALLAELSRRLRRADEQIGGLVLLDVAVTDSVPPTVSSPASGSRQVASSSQCTRTPTAVMVSRHPTASCSTCPTASEWRSRCSSAR